MAADHMILAGVPQEGVMARRNALVAQLHSEMGVFVNPLMEKLIMKGEQLLLSKTCFCLGNNAMAEGSWCTLL